MDKKPAPKARTITAWGNAPVHVQPAYKGLIRHRTFIRILWVVLLCGLGCYADIPDSKFDNPEGKPAAILWKMPQNIPSQDLLYGCGGESDVPRGPYQFIQEDLEGTSPKFDVCDRNGIKWKVKFGVEARPEIAASRLVWAVGYFTAEYYLVPRLLVQNMPVLKRGRKMVASDGSIYGARLKRMPDHERKIDNWIWKDNPFKGTREFNGLRVMMALINNWDLKDSNTGILEAKGPEAADTIASIYIISDLGSSFGTNKWIQPHQKIKGNLPAYSRSRFIRAMDESSVDFDIAGRPALINAANFPLYFQYLRMTWIGRKIPLEDVRWIGQLLSKLTPEQIRDAFRAAGYPKPQVEGFAQIVLSRIVELNKL
jgi:hypothetical protein